MKLDLDALHSRLPKIPLYRMKDMILHATVALQRRHQSPVIQKTRVFQESHQCELCWVHSTKEDALQLDVKAVVELGAEAIALGIGNAARGWNIVRRLQQGESADWLLSDPEGNLIAFEASGTDEGSLETRVKQKLEQVDKCEACEEKAVGVVRFFDPEAMVGRP